MFSISGTANGSSASASVPPRLSRVKLRFQICTTGGREAHEARTKRQSVAAMMQGQRPSIGSLPLRPTRVHGLVGCADMVSGLWAALLLPLEGDFCLERCAERVAAHAVPLHSEGPAQLGVLNDTRRVPGDRELNWAAGVERTGHLEVTGGLRP